MKERIFYTTFFLLFLPLLVLSAEYRAIKDGNWSDPTTWDQGSVPGAGDDVSIEGYAIYVTPNAGDVTIASLLVQNYDGRNATLFSIDANLTFTVTNDFSAVANNISQDVEVQLFGSSMLRVTGNASFIRTEDNNQKNMLRLNIQDSSRMEVNSNFLFDYKAAKSSEETEEVYLNNAAQLQIGGHLNVAINGGKNLNFDLYNYSHVVVGGNMDVDLLGGHRFYLNVDATSDMVMGGDADFLLDGAQNFMNLNVQGAYNVGGDLKLDSKSNGKKVDLIASGAALDVNGDLSMSAASANDVSFTLQDQAELSLAGNFLRPTNYGSFDMDASSTVVFDGTKAQAVPANTTAGGGGDEFTFTNIRFDNKSGLPMTLAGPLQVEDELELSEGVIEIGNGGSVVVAGNGVISGGSPTAYIDGPITKIGSTNGENFVFPTGNNGVYAPIEISPLSNPNDEYTIQYRDDPPPIEDQLTAPAASLNTRGYWSVERTPGSDIPNWTLNWSDAEARGISSLDNAIVAFVDTTENSLTPNWISLGRSSTTGSTGSGISGSITQSLDDPPPIEDRGIITIGFTPSDLGVGVSSAGSSGLVLPVELTTFTATEYQGMVSLEWETETEVNSHYFEVQRSMKGQQFETIGTMPAKINSSVPSRYAMTDTRPYRGQSYYRLKIVDLDGSYELSDIIGIYIDPTGRVMLYPNPVVDFIQLVGGPEFDESTHIEVVDQLGRRIFSGQLPVENNRLLLLTNQLNIREGGTYYIKLQYTSGRSESFKFIKVY